MIIFLRCAFLFCCLTGTLITAVAQGLSAGEPILSHFPSGSIRTDVQASAALDAVQKEKQSAEAEYRKRQQACYGQFLVTPCLTDEKTRYQQITAAIRSVELEASRFQRQQKVLQTEQRYREADAERLRNAPEDALKRQQSQQVYLQKQRDAQNRQDEQKQKLERAESSIQPPRTSKTVVSDAAMRQRNADEQREKVRQAAERREQTAQRRAKNQAARLRKQEAALETSQPQQPAKP